MDFGLLFGECIEALGNEVTIFSNEKSNELYDSFQNQVPFTPFTRVDWSKINHHHLISDLSEVASLLNQEFVEVYWSYGNYPVIKTNFQNVINAFDDLITVSSDTYLYVPMKYVIEVYHDGEKTIGYLLTSLLH
ncbi:CDI toxin immunity protein [Neobacillus vireti]|uniref:CDI toxin immunity protein n=1 Tax=Neobacillus vireti TaxID=220686 RepID=UPI003000A43E